MKKLIPIGFIFLAIVSFSQNYTLDITVAHLPRKDIYLATFYGDKNAIIDTAFPDTSGLFKFTFNDLNNPGMYRVFLLKDVFFDIIYNRENINIKSDYDNLYENLEVIQSTENKIYYDFLRKMNDYRRKFELLSPLNDYYPATDSFYFAAKQRYIEVQDEMQLYIDEVLENHPDAWTAKIIERKRPLVYKPELNEMEKRTYTVEHFFDHFDFTDVELIRSNVYTTSAIDYMSLYSNPNLTQDQLEAEFIKAVDKIMYEAMDNSLIYSFITEYLVGGFEKFHFDKVLEYIAETYAPEQCENEERKSDLQTRLKKYAELSVGKPAPEIIIPDVNGKEIKLSEIQADYTLVIFWASWCPHCNEILPQIHNVYQSSINFKKMSVLSISLDKEKTDWIKALTEGNYTWLNTSDLKGWDSRAAIDYNVYATPTMFLLDKNKNIVAKPITFEELKQALFKENIIK